MDPVRIFTKGDCLACTATMKWLDRKGLSYTIENYDESPFAQALAAMHGLKSAPICIYGDNIWSGFRIDMLSHVKC